jgi:hypothetical protein
MTPPPAARRELAMKAGHTSLVVQCWGEAAAAVVGGGQVRKTPRWPRSWANSRRL